MKGYSTQKITNKHLTKRKYLNDIAGLKTKEGKLGG